jgi:CheY-like chemotaxis protein
LDNKLVLIADDTPTNVGVISGVLRGSFRTKVATNGEKALVLASTEDKPDLILLDVMMPGRIRGTGKIFELSGNEM